MGSGTLPAACNQALSWAAKWLGCGRIMRFCIQQLLQVAAASQTLHRQITGMRVVCVVLACIVEPLLANHQHLHHHAEHSAGEA